MLETRRLRRSCGALVGSMSVLPNVIARHLDVVFCGTAVGKRSAELGAYYAGPGNKFCPTLHQIRLTPRRLLPAEYRKLLRWRLGLTDLLQQVSGPASTLRRKDFLPPRLRTPIAK